MTKDDLVQFGESIMAKIMQDNDDNDVDDSCDGDSGFIISLQIEDIWKIKYSDTPITNQ